MKLLIPERLIRLGYWFNLDKFEKVKMPILEFYYGDKARIYFDFVEMKHGKISSIDNPLDISDIDFEVNIKQIYWDEDPAITYSTSEGSIVKCNPTQGLMRLDLSEGDIELLNQGHHAFYLTVISENHETLGSTKRIILKDFIDILKY